MYTYIDAPYTYIIFMNVLYYICIHSYRHNILFQNLNIDKEII